MLSPKEECQNIFIHIFNKIKLISMRDRNIIYILHIRDCILQIEKYSFNLKRSEFLKLEEK